MTEITSTLVRSGVASLLFAGISAHAATILGNASDRELEEGTVAGTRALGAVDNGTNKTSRAGSAANGGRNALFVFQMPDFGAVANPFLTADIGLRLASVSPTPAYNVDLYALGIQTSATLSIGSGVLSSDRFYEANTIDSGATLIQQDFVVTTATGAGFRNTDATGDANLLSFLNSAYAGGAGAGQYVVFRANPDAEAGSGAVGYNFNAGDTTTPAFLPVITYIPEPSSALALLAATPLVFRRRR